MSKYQIGMSQNFQQELSMRNKSQISVKFVRNVLKRGVKMPFKCTFYESIFFQKQHMRGHVEKVHEGKNPFYVLFVKKKYPKEWLNWLITFPYFMKEKIHSKCDICDNTFEQKMTAYSLISKRFMMQSGHSCVPIATKGFKKSLHHKRRMTCKHKEKEACFLI